MAIGLVVEDICCGQGCGRFLLSLGEAEKALKVLRVKSQKKRQLEIQNLGFSGFVLGMNFTA
jgi:hypothetical protein